MGERGEEEKKNAREYRRGTNVAVEKFDCTIESPAESRIFLFSRLIDVEKSGDEN